MSEFLSSERYLQVYVRQKVPKDKAFLGKVVNGRILYFVVSHHRLASLSQRKRKGKRKGGGGRGGKTDGGRRAQLAEAGTLIGECRSQK